MTGGRSRALLAAVTCALAAAAIALAPAGGPAAGQSPPPGADAFIEETTFGLESGFSGSAVAQCPAGSRATGGGVSTTDGSSPGGGYTYVIGLSGPLDETGFTANTVDGDVARSWYAWIYNNAGAPRTFRVFAICSRTSDATIETRSATLFAGPLFAPCPAGSRAVGGGLGTTAPAPTGPMTTPLYQLESSGPYTAGEQSGSGPINGAAAIGWDNRLFTTGSEPAPYRAFALCSPTSDAVVARVLLGVQPSSGSPPADSRTVTCPAGRRALGGGIRGPAILSQLSNPLDETGFIASTLDGDTPRGWFGYAAYDASLLARPAVAVLCARDVGTGGGGGPGGGPGAGVAGGGGTGAPAPARCAGVAATLRGTDGADRLRGTARRDVIAAGAGADRVSGLGGADLVCGGPGADVLLGGAGADRLLGEGGADRLAGGLGADRLLGGAGKDRLAGGAGRDALFGGPGVDRQLQ